MDLFAPTLRSRTGAPPCRVLRFDGALEKNGHLVEQRPGDQTWDMNNSSRSFQRQIVPHRRPILQDILGNDHRYGPLSDVSNVVSAQRVAKTVCLVTENFGQRVDEAADLLSQMGLQS